jgi:hypothetical protein
VAVPAARADGDPASDVLLFQKVFLPFYEPVPKATAAELKRVVAKANAAGYGVRVAVIGGKGDLGSVPSFWGKPQPYAVFLGQELSLVPNSPYRERVLVVMPNGYGLSRNGKALTSEKGPLKALQTPAEAKEDPSAGAILAVQALAGAKGVKIDAKVPRAPGSGGSHRTLELAGIGVMLLAVAAALEIARRVRRRNRAA